MVRVISCVILCCSVNVFSQESTVRIGSKKFTESVILGEIVTRLLQSEGVNAEHVRELGGTRVVWNALETGDIDVYVEYSGTLRYEILQAGGANIEDKLAEHNLAWSRPLGFNNTYAIAVPERLADSLGLTKISDLRNHTDLVFGLTNEFMDRQDGWPNLRERYRLSATSVTGMDHDLAYRGIASGDIQVTDVYSTDADIAYYHLRPLEDDRHVFPDYWARVVYAGGISAKAPMWSNMLDRLENQISDSLMRAMNAAVKLQGQSESDVANDFLHLKGGAVSRSQSDHASARILQRTVEHLVLVGVSLFAALVIALPIGIWGARNKRLGDAVVSATGVVQVIPSLALLVMLIPLLGIGFKPAVVALFLYSLLPIVRNTQTGIRSIDVGMIESATALGLPSMAILRRIELPLAMPHIISGIKTSAVINIGTATLGALIGAGGYGQPILTGIRLDNVGLILEGAVPAALLALIAQGVLGWVEKLALPKDLPTA